VQLCLSDSLSAEENVGNLNNKRLVSSAQFPHASVVLDALHSLAILSPRGLLSSPAGHISPLLWPNKKK